MKSVRVEKKEAEKKGKTFEGKVVSLGMTKSMIVELSFSHAHPLYKKQMRKTKRVAVRNENPDIKIGQFVEIIETRPQSKTIHFSVNRLITK